ncbi:hypothetical protein N1851_022620 [Merluccius polli]|uniref:Uncharacterized protein n=1 Tax=Merluccius polli TaxID=89951 RepID=A0AA47MHY3_MERPO|nr:hypothetical protein N1851_022620 [Merluccius polli]
MADFLICGALAFNSFGDFNINTINIKDSVQSTMDEETEEGGPPSETTLSGEHGRHSRAKSPEQQERADSPGPSGVSMKSDHSMRHPDQFKDGNQSVEKR